jgi:branched-subunit amino acid aminotransferase/4-amino-4-deoxychorismate lyase
LVVNLARKNKFKVEERDISMKDFLAADEIFLAATNKDIVPIVNVDGGKIGNGKVGKVTKRLMDIFESFVKKY